MRGAEDWHAASIGPGTSRIGDRHSVTGICSDCVQRQLSACKDEASIIDSELETSCVEVVRTAAELLMCCFVMGSER